MEGQRAGLGGSQVGGLRYLILDTNDKPPTEHHADTVEEAKKKVDELFQKRSGRTKEEYLRSASLDVGCEPKDLEPLFYQLTFRHGLMVGKRKPDGIYDMKESVLLDAEEP